MALPGFGRPPAYYFIWILPRNSFNRLCGLVADAKLPRFLLRLLIRLFSWKYGVNLNEASKHVSVTSKKGHGRWSGKSKTCHYRPRKEAFVKEEI